LKEEESGWRVLGEIFEAKLRMCEEIEEKKRILRNLESIG